MAAKKWGNYLMLAPALMISLCVVFIPGILTVLISFTDWNGVSSVFSTGEGGVSLDLNFIGAQNYGELFADRIFWRSLANNSIWTVLFLTIPVVIGLLTAVLLFRRKRGRTAYQLIFLFPYVLAPVTNAMLWLNIIYNPRSGVFGYMINTLGWNVVNPLQTMDTALFGAAAVDIWHYWGFLTVVYLAALRQTPDDQIEAAEVEGAGAWQLFRHVYFPNIKPTFQLMFVMIMINSFLTFDYIYLLTQGGPARATEMLSTYAREFAFRAFQMGKGAAVALFMSIMGLIASALYTWLSRRDIME